MATHVVRNENQSRYELQIDGRVVGIADYSLNGHTMTFPHTEIDPSMRGQGLGEQLVRGALDDVRRCGYKAIPLCWYVREVMDTEPVYAELRATA